MIARTADGDEAEATIEVPGAPASTSSIGAEAPARRRAARKK